MLRAYELKGGDTIHVDTGVYPLLETIILSGKTDVGWGNDVAFAIRGPSLDDVTAEFITAIPGNTSQTLVELDDADYITR